MADRFEVSGEIRSRWGSYGGANGPFGRPIGPAQVVPGFNGLRQTFEMGEIATAAEQGMVVSVFRLRNEACFDWQKTDDDTDFFRYDIAFNGVPQGQARLKISGTTRIWTRLQGFGEYAFIVKACHSPLIGADRCTNFTLPVRLQFTRVDETPNPGGIDVDGVIGERWHELGAWAGPLGRPLQHATDFPAGFRGQRFERGWIATAPAFGPHMVVAVYRRGHNIEVNWGGADTSFNAFRVDIRHNGALRQELLWIMEESTEWARRSIGSGQFVLKDPPEGAYEFHINPTVASSPFPSPGEVFPFGQTPDMGFDYRKLPIDVAITAPPINSTPAQAFASHAARISDIARHFAERCPLRVSFFVPPEEGGEATEDDMVQLLAHFDAALGDREFRVPGELPSRILALIRLTQLKRGPTGTSFDIEIVSRKGDYDFALKGLLLIPIRYRALLTDELVTFFRQHLFAEGLSGAHDIAVEFYEVTFFNIDVPESENHLLMIETCRYVTNQLLFVLTLREEFNNETNGLADWLLDHLQRLARHDFLEFNSRPYGRMSLHALMVLYEVAAQPALKTAAQIVLDYIMVKFAVSSSRNRRVSPFRRLRERTNSPTTVNDLRWDRDGDPMTGFFNTYTGVLEHDGRPSTMFPDSWTFCAVLAGTTSYRPPPAAYNLAMLPSPPALHRFYHGTRPELLAADDTAEGGVEIYYRSPSFLLSAGGMFLNSGYGSDATFSAPQVAIAGATTLIPAKLDLMFADLIRFDAIPDWRDVANTGVHAGFACGENLRIPDRWFELTGAPREGPWTFLNLNRDVPGGTLGFYVAAYRTPPREDEDDVDNLGLLYAMEATMDFAEFERVTRLRNRTLPERLDFETVMVFNTPHPDPDRHSFAFRFLKEGSKYDMLIIEMDDASLGGNFRRLPLVEGPWLQAPGGHDGLIHIRDQHCQTPLVLDYRNSRAPRREDNRTACPQPWIDRNQALRDFAGELLTRSHFAASAGQTAEALDFARKAVTTLRPLNPAPDEAAIYWPFFAATVWILSMRLMDAQRLDDAVEAGRESIALHRRAAAVPGVNLHALTGDLLTLSHQLTTAGRLADAIEPVAAAADILRVPAFAPGSSAELAARFAISLSTLTRRLFDAGRGADAVAPGAEAAGAFEHAATIAGADPVGLAGEAVNLSVLLANRSRPNEALALVQVAVRFMRPVASAPDGSAATRSLFASLLETSARRLRELDRLADALAAATEALVICERLAEEDPAAFSGQLASVRQLVSQLTTG